jgi:aryl-alcohol dehydrogenase-like predicted oxidoreductase
MMIKQYQIPNTDLKVSALCFGGSGFGTDIKGKDADRLVSDFIEAGGCFFDTAHCYSFWVKNGLGASEREFGACLKRLSCWNKVVVGTKGGHPDGGVNYRRPDAYMSENMIKSDVDESLKRLGAERIDLYYLHRDDPRMPSAEVIGILNREIERGRIRYIGASNWSIQRIAEANEYASKHGLQGFVTSQLHWSLADPNWESGPDPIMRYVTEEDREWYASVGISIVAYSSTAGGYFASIHGSSGTYDNPTNIKRRNRAEELASNINCTTAQIAMAYLLHQKPLTIPIFRTTNQAHLAEIMDSVSINLSNEQVQWLRNGEKG